MGSESTIERHIRRVRTKETQKEKTANLLKAHPAISGFGGAEF